jgi:hypothetical protein
MSGRLCRGRTRPKQNGPRRRAAEPRASPSWRQWSQLSMYNSRWNRSWQAWRTKVERILNVDERTRSRHSRLLSHDHHDPARAHARTPRPLGVRLFDLANSQLLTSFLSNRLRISRGFSVFCNTCFLARRCRLRRRAYGRALALRHENHDSPIRNARCVQHRSARATRVPSDWRRDIFA